MEKTITMPLKEYQDLIAENTALRTANANKEIYLQLDNYSTIFYVGEEVPKKIEDLLIRLEKINNRLTEQRLNRKEHY